jgi:hypothetical protein
LQLQRPSVVVAIVDRLCRTGCHLVKSDVLKVAENGFLEASNMYTLCLSISYYTKIWQISGAATVPLI